MEIRLLRVVEVWAGPNRLEVGPPRQRTVLAALAVDAGRVVPVEVLVDRVWGPDAPPHVRRTLHTHITRVRRVVEQLEVEPDRPVRVVRRADGYVLEVDPDQVDLLRFRRMAAAARGCERSDADRVRLLSEALGLWEGVPLAGLAGEWATRQRGSLQLERLGAVLDWARAALRLGAYAQVVAVVGELVELHPYDEALAVTLGWALAAAGRRSEAIDHCRTVSLRLRQEAGVDPGPQLRAVHEAVLADQPLPDLQAAPAPAVQPVARPAQLPGDVPGFVGRAAELARLDAVLASTAAQAPTAVVITTVSGGAGVGKTTLAVRWTRRVADRFTDGQLYADLRGFDPGGQIMRPTAVLRRFLDALGVPPDRIPAEPDAQAALYRSLLAGKRVLVLLDNARDADHARPLLPGTPTALTVVTSRNPLTGLVAADGAYPLTLDLLPAGEARELLARRIGPARTAAEPEAVADIVAACARLPLALALVAARAAIHPTFTLTALAAELGAAAQARRPDTGPLARVRTVFSWSYLALSRPAARLFRHLGLHPGPEVTAAAAASLIATSPSETYRSLAELTHTGLLAERSPGRYRCHDLLRTYAADLAGTTEPTPQRQAATTRLLDHYTHSAYAADRLLHPTREPLAMPLTRPAAGTDPERPADARAALAWLAAEHQVLLAAQRLASRTGADATAWQLAWALDTFLDRQGHWHDELAAWRTALTAADRLGDLAATVHAHRAAGDVSSMLGRHDQACTQLQRALHLYARAGDQVGQAHTHIHLSIANERHGRADRALHHAAQALALYRAANHLGGQAMALNAVGWDHALLGDHAQALSHCRQALTLHQRAGDRDGQAATWDSLGYAHHHLRQHRRAVGCYRHAVALYRDLGDRHLEADTLVHLGDTLRAAGHPATAAACWTSALDILTDLDHPDARRLHTKLAALLESTVPCGPGR